MFPHSDRYTNTLNTKITFSLSERGLSEEISRMDMLDSCVLPLVAVKPLIMPFSPARIAMTCSDSMWSWSSLGVSRRIKTRSNLDSRALPILQRKKETFSVHCEYTCSLVTPYCSVYNRPAISGPFIRLNQHIGNFQSIQLLTAITHSLSAFFSSVISGKGPLAKCHMPLPCQWLSHSVTHQVNKS